MKLFETTAEKTIIRKIDRRTFLKAGGISATGIILGLQFAKASTKDTTSFSPNAFLTVTPDGSITIIAHRSEMGTGIRTGLPLIVADELEADWKYIGKSTGIVDIKDIVAGKTIFGQDVKVEGAKYATILRCPVAGGKVRSFKSDKAQQIPGVIKILEIASPGFPADFTNPLGGIVVVADNTWTAIRARKELEVEWDFGPNAGYNSEAYFNDMLAKVKEKGHVRRAQGSIEAAIKDAHNVIESTYTIPHLAHASMEPPNAVANVQDGKCEVWAPTQHPQWAKESVAKALKIDKTNVTV